MRKNLVLSAVALLAISSLVGCSKPKKEQLEYVLELAWNNLMSETE